MTDALYGHRNGSGASARVLGALAIWGRLGTLGVGLGTILGGGCCDAPGGRGLRPGGNAVGWGDFTRGPRLATLGNALETILGGCQ